MRFILPVILALLGAGAGFGAGYYLKPEVSTAHPDADDTRQDAHATEQTGPAQTENDEGSHADAGTAEFIKLNNQFVIPVLKDGRVKSMVVMSLSLEAAAGSREQVYAQEPKIRDAFLQVMFDYANAGGFDGNFTSGSNMEVLRNELRLAAHKLLSHVVTDVLVTDLARQDLS